MRKFIQSAVLGKMLLAAAFCTATLFSFAGWAVDVYPFPGVSISPDSAIPSDGHGVVLFDLGLPVTERSSVYGLSVSLGGSGYNDTLVGGQVGLVGWAKNAYGAQLGFSNSAEKGVGVQVGILNFYDDESFRVQIGLVNSQFFSLNWNYGRDPEPGGYGVQLGLVNRSCDGGHLQVGMFNVGHKTSVVQIGLFNFVDKESRCLQLGLVNDRGSDSSPFLGWRW